MHFQWFAVAAATMPLYILNAPTKAPKDFKLDPSDFPGVVSHFLGSSELASQGAVDAAQFVPGTFLDSRKSSAIVVTEFGQLGDALGDVVLEVEDVTSPKETDVSTPLSGDAALDAVRSLDKIDSQTLLVSASGIEAELEKLLKKVDSKVMVLGVSHGKAIPIFRPKAQGAVEAQAEAVKEGQAEEQAEEQVEEQEPLSSSIAATFSSLEHCQSQTRNCSGHGECVKAHGAWSCACKATTENKYTTYWGGNACEKRDVSWQFNLLLWTAVGILLATVAGVSLLFSIDSEKLPGVLNAAT